MGEPGQPPKRGPEAATWPRGVDVAPGDPLEAAALQGATGTLPERIVQRWLESAGHLYQAEHWEMGGRLVLGGAVVDFVVYDLAPQPVVLRVMGEYWHGELPGRQARDDEQAQRLRRMGYLVVDLWESAIYAAALAGRVGSYVLGEVDRALG